MHCHRTTLGSTCFQRVVPNCLFLYKREAAKMSAHQVPMNKTAVGKILLPQVKYRHTHIPRPHRKTAHYHTPHTHTYYKHISHTHTYTHFSLSLTHIPPTGCLVHMPSFPQRSEWPDLLYRTQNQAQPVLTPKPGSSPTFHFVSA